MIQILRVKGWILNPSDKVVNNIIRAVERNYGKCPCSSNTSEDKHCPCSSYREGKGCCCGLYKCEKSLDLQLKEEYNSTYSPETNNIEGD